MHMRRRTMLLVLASCAAEQLSVHISPFMSAGSTQPICSGGPDCRQALTATFSLAMISLGEDFGAGALPAALVPFQLDPPIPGKLRWVTTTIARFDADDAFPPSLNFTLRLSGMASRSGATLRRLQKYNVAEIITVGRTRNRRTVECVCRP